VTPSRRRPMRARAQQEPGFTLLEVIVAVLLIALVIGALGSFFVSDNDSALAGQRQVNLLAVAQAQIESIHQTVKQYGFTALWLNADPATPTDSTLPTNPGDPDDFVKGDGTSSASFLVEQNYNNTALGEISNAPAAGEPLLTPEYCATLASGSCTTPGVAPEKTVTALPATATNGGAIVTVYTYVTVPSIACTGCAASDSRRVVIAVVLNNPGGTGRGDLGPNKPFYLTTMISNAVPTNDPSSASGLRLGLNIT
jgi:prepilin-type N-terminal cleavage/methylation domain-containing protein